MTDPSPETRLKGEVELLLLHSPVCVVFLQSGSPSWNYLHKAKLVVNTRQNAMEQQKCQGHFLMMLCREDLFRQLRVLSKF